MSDQPAASDQPVVGFHYRIHNAHLNRELSGTAVQILGELEGVPAEFPLTPRQIGTHLKLVDETGNVVYEGAIEPFLIAHANQTPRAKEILTACKVMGRKVLANLLQASGVPETSTFVADRFFMARLVQLGAAPLLARLVREQPGVTDPAYDGYYVPLHLAAFAGSEELFDAAQRRIADVDVRGHFDMTALHWASANGQIRMVERLLELGAQLELGNHWSWTALDIAESNGFETVADALRSHGAVKHPNGPTAWTLTCYGAM